jgi:hypothetical protein
MDGKWGKIAILGLFLAFSVGCRTSRPNLEPPKQPEALTSPPAEARYNAPGFPKEVMRRDDPTRLFRQSNENQIMPARFGTTGGPGSMPYR